MKFFVFFFVLGAVQSVPKHQIHNLHYIYTALSKPIGQPGVYQFTAMGMLNDRPIDYYNSEEKVKRPLQKWMKENNGEDYWQKGTQSRKSKEQWFNVNVNILIERLKQNHSDVHVLQWMHGCEAENTPTGLKFRRGFDQYGYDGADFLSFNDEDMVWVAPRDEALPTKRKWDKENILSQYTKGYLETDCVQWLGKFMKFQSEEDKKQSPPQVYIFSKKSARPDRRTLVCLATDFYPKDVVVDIFRDGVRLGKGDGVWSSGVRPNGDPLETYQLRKTLEIESSDTAEYSCQIEHVTLEKPILKVWGGTSTDRDNKSNGFGPIIGGAIVAILLILAGLVVFFILRRRKSERVIDHKVKNMHPCGLTELESGTKTLIPATDASNGSLSSGDSGKGSLTGSQGAEQPLMSKGVASDLGTEANGHA
ncbi:hypothetical protein GJAV_G00105400 [Gymnothorax javanicus]|nr:hypothetical protein GJAV_G00105400 [Gymnothorax javanicus]